MGVSFSAITIIGIPVSAIFETRRATTNVTKYDPDTGKPYDAVQPTTVYVIGGKQVDAEAAEKFKETYQYNYDEHGLKLHVASSEGDDADGVLGIALAEADPGKQRAVPWESLATVRNRVIDELKKIAPDLEYNPHVYTMCQVG